jgi:hypothetical protein
VDTSVRDELKAVPQKQAATAKKEVREQEQDTGASAGRLRAESNQRFEEEQRAARGQRADALQQNKLEAARQKPSGNEVAGAAPVSPPTASPPAAAAEAAPMAKAMVARPAPLVEIVSSNPGSRWRIVAGRSVQRSMDGGSTWQDQELGVSVALTAGSSPMPSVCWLVGSGGTVLVTVDGRTWRRVAFPEAVELIAVRATDAQSATVTTADGRTFSTVDGGATWGRTGV